MMVEMVVMIAVLVNHKKTEIKALENKMSRIRGQDKEEAPNM